LTKGGRVTTFAIVGEGITDQHVIENVPRIENGKELTPRELAGKVVAKLTERNPSLQIFVEQLEALRPTT
jgi:hypothetical protein